MQTDLYLFNSECTKPRAQPITQLMPKSPMLLIPPVSCLHRESSTKCFAKNSVSESSAKGLLLVFANPAFFGRETHRDSFAKDHSKAKVQTQ